MNVTCQKCGFVDSGHYCSQCGSGLERSHPIHKIAKILVAPLYEYWRYFKSMLRPEQMVAEIQSGKFDFYDLLSFFVASVAISSVVEYFFPSEALFPNLIPIVGEAVTALLVLGLVGMTNAPLHFIYDFKNRDVAFSQFFIASAAITALYYPWLGLANGVLASFGMQHPERSTSYGTFYLYMQTYRLLYKRSQWFVGGGMLIYLALLLLIVAAVLWAVL